MDLLSCVQFQDEKFQDYFFRFRMDMLEQMKRGFERNLREMCMLLLAGMCSDTYSRVRHACNVKLIDLEPEECWEFLTCFSKLDEFEVTPPMSFPTPMVEEDTLVVPNTPCVTPPSSMHFGVLEVGVETPSSKLEAEDGEYLEFIHATKGTFHKPLDPFGEYAERPPPHLIWTNHISSYEQWVKRFDKLKRFLNSILLGFILFLGYNCFMEMCAKSYDRLLRALSMFDKEQ